MSDNDVTKVAEDFVFGVSISIFVSFIIISVIFESFRTFETSIAILVTGILSIVRIIQYIYWDRVVLIGNRGGGDK